MSLEELNIIEDCLKDESKAALAGQFVIQLASHPDMEPVFLTSSTFLKTLLNHLDLPDVLKSVLIFSGNPNISKKLIEHGVLTQLMKKLSKNVHPKIPLLKEEEKKELVVKKEYVEIKAEDRSDIEIILMAMSNFTTYPEGQVAAVLEDNPQLYGTLLSLLIDMVEYFKENPDFNYAANVITNSSSHELGLKLMLESRAANFLPKIIEQAKVCNLLRRMTATMALKNLMFSHELLIDSILEHLLIEALGHCLIEINALQCSKTIDEELTLCPEWELAYYSMDEKEDLLTNLNKGDHHFDSLNHCLLDALVLIANEDKGLKRMKELGL